jgi:hypothetical protein
MNDEGYVKGVGWRLIRDIKCTSTKDAEIMDGYYNRRIEGWGYVKTPVRVVLEKNILDDTWHLIEEPEDS